MELRALKFMSPERRDAFLARDDVNAFADRFRAMFRGAGSQSRAVSAADLLIPDVVLNVLRENIGAYSRLLQYVRVVRVNGTARQPVMGAIPEAIWMEACGSLNEINLSISQVETDGWKVGAYTAVCNAVLEDTNPVLINEILYALGVAIGKAIDKAILYGTGQKMPLGIVPRLAQTSAPANYPTTARPWENLSQSNIITIPATQTGLTLYQSIVTASGAAKGSYSANGAKFWAMSDATKTHLLSDAMSINATGAVISGLGDTMPVIGGAIVTMGDGGDIIPDNVIVGGYGDEYLLSERAGTSIAYSDIPLFLDDHTVFKGTARYDGVPAIPEGFVVIGLGAAPATSMSFSPDIANKPDASLRDLAIGNLTLTPAFAPATLSYTAATSNDSDVIAVMTNTGTIATATVNGKRVTLGKPVVWADGENAVQIKVSKGKGDTLSEKTYSVTVTKS